VELTLPHRTDGFQRTVWKRDDSLSTLDLRHLGEAKTHKTLHERNIENAIGREPQSTLCRRVALWQTLDVLQHTPAERKVRVVFGESLQAGYHHSIDMDAIDVVLPSNRRSWYRIAQYLPICVEHSPSGWRLISE
jgi:hypothetical protein